MDPTILPALMNALAPVLGVLGCGAIPVGIIWIVKNHQFRMKELEVESQRYSNPPAQQLASIEARLASLEAAINAPPALRSPMQERAALLEGPAVAPPVRQR
jgi:hypothetical protein